MNCWGTYTRFLVENQILYYFSVFFFTIFSSTNGFQENYDFSFANILPHGVCSAVYHPQHSLLILGSLTGQGQRTSAGLLMWKENQVKKSGFVLIFFLSIVVVLIFRFFFLLQMSLVQLPFMVWLLGGFSQDILITISLKMTAHSWSK